VEVTVIGNLDSAFITHESSASAITISNPAPALPTELLLSPGYRVAKLNFKKPTDLDYIETRVYIGTISGFLKDEALFSTSAYDGSVSFAGLVEGDTYYVRLETYDPYGPGTLSSELTFTTFIVDPGGPWSKITNADRAFIDQYVEADSIVSTKIESIVAGKIATGTLAATNSIGVGDPLVDPYTMTIGAKAFGTEGVSLISVEQNTSGNAIFAFFESGKVKLNDNARVFADGGFHFGSAANNFIDYNGSQLVIETTEFKVDALGNASFSGELSAATGTFSGDISASTINGGTITGSIIQTANIGERVVIDGSTNNLKAYDTNNNLTVSTGGLVNVPDYTGTASIYAIAISYAFAIYGESNSNAAILGHNTGGGSLRAGIEGRGTGSLSRGIQGYSGQFGTAIDGFAPGDGTGVDGFSSNGRGVEGSGATFDFYAYGNGANYGPFTGAHDGLIEKKVKVIQGDILVATGQFEKSSLSNTIPYLTISSSAYSKAAYGIFVSRENFKDPEKYSHLFKDFGKDKDKELAKFLEKKHPAALKYVTQGDKNKKAVIYDTCIENALGEGQINVCSENGDLEVGDFICTSNLAGKGMRYDGQDMRYVVAKCMEPVVWADEPSNIKMVACIYLCG